MNAFIVCLLCCAMPAGIIAPAVSAHPRHAAQPAVVSTRCMQMGFRPNVGQIADQYGHPRSDVLYAYADGGFRLFLRRDGFSYELATASPTGNGISEATSRRMRGDGGIALLNSRVDVDFVAPSPFMQVEAENTLPGEIILYTPPASPARPLRLREYATVAFRGLYPGIDLVFHVTPAIADPGHAGSAPPTVKYEYVLHPGARMSDIATRYTGALGMQVDEDGALEMHTAAGLLRECRPVAWLLPEGGRRGSVLAVDTVAVSARLAGDVLRYEAGIIDARRTLVIDPTVLWSTYYGGGNYDSFQGVAIDGSDYIYAAGYAQSNIAIATTGAYQTTLLGASDAMVVKLTPGGVREWGTYYGGSEEDMALGITNVGTTGVAVVGVTWSISGIATAGAHQTTFGGGGYDAFLAMFTYGGMLGWGTYYGGPGNERLQHVQANSSGTLAIAGYTSSTSGIASAGAHQTAYGGGSYDAFFATLTSGGARQYGSYYGGSDEDEGYDAAITANGDVVLCGYTKSASGIATAGAHQTAPGGSQDACIALFNNQCIRQWGTYFGGSGADLAMNIAVDGSGSITVFGTTGSPNQIASGGAYQPALNGSNTDCFLATFSLAGTRNWSTYYGGSNIESIGGLTVDAQNDIIVTGVTASGSAMASAGAYQTAHGGGLFDAFIAGFSSIGQRQWGTYFGGGGSDAGLGVALDSQSDIIIAGSTSSISAIATAGAHQATYGGFLDGFVMKFGNAAAASITCSVVRDTLCAGDTVTVRFDATGTFSPSNIFTAQLSDAFGNFAAPAVIGTLNGPDGDSILCRIPVGTPLGIHYRIRVVSSLPVVTGSNNGIDIVIFPLPNPQITATGPTTICTGDSVTLCGSIAAGILYQWYRDSQPMPGANGVCYVAHTAGSYTLEETNAGRCKGISPAVVVVVKQPPLAVIAPAGPIRICEGDSVVLTVSSTAIAVYEWYDSTGFISAGSPTLVVRRSGSYRARVIDTSGCSAMSASVQIAVEPLPPALIAPDGTVTLCEGDTLPLTATAGPGFTYQWKKNGVPLSGATLRAYLTRESGSYTVVVTSASGCSATSPPTIVILRPLPMVTLTTDGRDPVICAGDSMLLRAISSSPGIIAWSRNGAPMPGLISRTIVVREDGLYRAVITDTGGCSGASDSIIVTVKSRPVVRIEALSATVFCEGDSVALRAVADAGVALQWKLNGMVIDSANRTVYVVRHSGIYTVEATNLLKCSTVSNSIAVDVRPLPVAEIQPAGARTLCAGDSLVLHGSSCPTCTCVWFRNGAEVKRGPDTQYVARTDGSYRLAVLENAGCSDTSEVVLLSVVPRPSISVEGPSTACEGSIGVYVARHGSARGLRWVVTGAALLGDATRDTARVRWTGSGTATVHCSVESDSGACSADTTILVRVGSSLQPMVQADRPTALCLGDSVRLDAGDGYLRYRWSTGDSTRFIVVHAAGNYSVTVWDAAGCTGASPPLAVTVHDPPAPVIVADGPLTFCAGDSVMLRADRPYAALRWSTGDSAIAITVRASGSFSLNATDSTGCSGLSPSVDVVVHPVPAPRIIAAGAPDLCPGDSLVLSLDTRYAAQRWSNGDTASFIVVRDSGAWFADVVDANGCSARTPALRVTSHALPGSINGPNSLCIGSMGAFSVPDVPGVTYRWSCSLGDLQGTDDAPAVTVRWLAACNDTLRLMATNGPCSIVRSYVVIVAATLQPRLTPEGTITLCAGDSLVISAPSGYASYQWSTGDTTQRIVVRAGGRYAVFVRDAMGCSGSSDSLTVDMRPRPVPRLTRSGQVSLCEGDTLVITTSGTYASYRWNRGDTARSIVIRNAGLYFVSAADSAGCTGQSDTLQVLMQPLPMPRIVPPGPIVLCQGDTLTLDAGAGWQSQRWSTGDSTRYLRVTQSGSYSLRVWTASGCTGDAVPVSVTVLPVPPAPTLTRNGDTLFCSAAAAYAWYRNDTLLAGETANRLLLRGPGRYRVVTSDTAGCPASTDIDVRMRAVVLEMPHITALPGDRVCVPVTVRERMGLLPGDTAPLAIDLAYDPNVMVPDGHPQGQLDTLGLHLHTLRLIGMLGVADTVIAADFRVMLGAVDSSLLTATASARDSSALDVTVIPGVLRVIVCREGGARLFDGSGRVALFQNQPNPFNAATVVDYETAEAGPTELFVLDLLGRRVATLYSGVPEPGRHRAAFDASRLASGFYLCVLRTPSELRTRTMHLLK